jgi:hypothetical protein
MAFSCWLKATSCKLQGGEWTMDNGQWTIKSNQSQKVKPVAKPTLNIKPASVPIPPIRYIRVPPFQP